MAKQPPEKLAAALRANLLRRKQGGTAKPGQTPPKSSCESAEKPPKNSA